MTRTQFANRWRAPAEAERSYWISDALAQEPSPYEAITPLSESITADVCVVGGGFTGLWTAIELKQRQPTIQVVLLEAGLCGSGASGTNAGMLMNLWPKMPALLKVGGPTEGPDVARASVDAIHYIRGFCTEHQIDAQWQDNGWLWASNNASQDDAWAETMESTLGMPGAPFREVGETSASELAGAPVRSGVLDPTCVGLNPARLVRGLLRVAKQLGVEVFESSPMTALETTPATTTVHTVNGAVRAASVILAINAWCSELPEVRRHLVMTASDNVVVRPRGDSPLRQQTNVSDSGRLLDYWRSLTDGNFLFGKAGTGLGWAARGATTLFGPVPRQGWLLAHMAQTVPAVAEFDVLSAWRAPVEYSVTSLPFFAALKKHPGVFYGTGYSGDGIGPSVLGAKVLASLALGSDDDLTSSFLTRTPTARALPPEPIRFLGGQLVKTALLRQDRLQDQGQQPGPVTKLLTKVDPTSFVGA